MDVLQYAIGGISAIALMPLVVTIIGGLNNARRERRRQAMLDRHAERVWR